MLQNARLVVIILITRRAQRFLDKHCLSLHLLITISLKRRKVDVITLTIFRSEITFIKKLTDFQLITEFQLSNNTFLK